MGMRFIGFDNFNWDTVAGSANPAYWFAVDEGNTFFPSVEPSILPRPGNYATFGVSQVGAMNIVGGFGYSGPLTPSAAFSNLWQQLNPVNAVARPLKCVREEDGILLTIPAILSIPNYSANKLINFKDAIFVCVQPFFLAQGFIHGQGGFL